MLVDRWRTALGALAAGPGTGPRHRGGGQRRRPDGGLGGGRRARGPLGGGGPGLARRRRGLPGLRWPDRVRRGRRLGLRPVRLRPAGRWPPTWSATSWSWPTGPGTGCAIALPGPVQPGQRGHGGHGGRRRSSSAAGPRATWRRALGRLDGVTEVAGRFSTITRSGHPVRLLLAKNPAGWTAIFDLLDETGRPGRPGGAVGQRPDGRRLRHVVAVGRALRAARRPAGGGHRRTPPRPRRAAPLRRGRPRRGGRPAGRHRPRRRRRAGRRSAIEFLGNYTAFADLRRAL